MANLKSSLRSALRTVRRYSNWSSLLSRPHAPQVHLRSGLKFTSGCPTVDRCMVDEIIFSRIYNPPGFYEISKGDTVIDIGGNIGIFSVYAAKQGAQVHTYEPFPGNVEAIHRNLKANGLEARVHQKAVSRSTGTARLYLSEISAGHLLFDHNNAGQLTKHIDVKTTTLQSIMDGLGYRSVVNFLKLDCEGSEGAIIASTPDLYLTRIRRIAMEFHDNVSVPTHQGIQSRLESLGFTTSLLWEDHGSPFGYLYATQGGTASR